MGNQTELQITKTLKYEALYLIMGYNEIDDGIFEKEYGTTTITVDTNHQSVDFHQSVSVINGSFVLGEDKSFVILECIDHMLSIGYSPIKIIIDMKNDFDIYVDNIYIKCFAWDWTKEKEFDTSLPISKTGKFFSTVYESRTYSGLIERRYTVSNGQNLFHHGLLENKDINLHEEENIESDNKDMKIQGKKLISYSGSETTVIIPDGIEEIQSGCFWDNQSIEEVVFPDTMKNIGGDTFYNCLNLKAVRITKNVEVMGNNPFAGCPNLILVNDSPSFTYENGLLMDCERTRVIYYQISSPAETVQIPNSVKIIGKHSFYLGENLLKLNIPKSVRKMENNPFSGCKNLCLTSDSEKYIVEDNVIYSSCYKDLVGTVGKIKVNPLVIRDVETISRNSFWNHEEIRKIILPRSLKQIGYNPFVGCSNIEFISESDSYKVKDGVLYNSDCTKLICYPSHLAIGVIHIPDSVLQLERGAFSGCKDMTGIHLKNVFSVGKNCFTNCVSLKQVYLSDLVRYIGEWAFAHCSSLLMVSIYKDCFVDKKAFENTTAKITIRNKKTNYLIESENLFTLKSMKENYKGKFDSILIDPPYNSHIDYIHYKDDYSLDYMNFMKERIVFSKELLSDHGFLVINIDEGEFKNLYHLCKEIFGSSLVSFSKWKKIHPYFDKNRVILNPNKKQTKYEYIIFCRKNKDSKFHQIMKPYVKNNQLLEKESKLPHIFDCFGTTSSAKDEIKEIFGDRTYFSTPKPRTLMRELIRATTDKDSLIMDFFAGSGTVGDACFELNKQDGGNRTFYLITNSENNICKSITFKRLEKASKKYSCQFELLD